MPLNWTCSSDWHGSFGVTGTRYHVHQWLSVIKLHSLQCQPQWHYGQGQFYTAARENCPPNLRLAPQMWHETLFDELKATAYRCKKEHSVTFKIRFWMGLYPGPCWGNSLCYPIPPSRLESKHPSHIPPHSAPRFSCSRHVHLVRHCHPPKYTI